MKIKTIKSDLICPECGNIFPIMRRTSIQRKSYHIKDLYCYKCDRLTKHIEVKDAMEMKKSLEFSTFKTEFEESLYALLCMNDKKEEVKCLIKNI